MYVCAMKCIKKLVVQIVKEIPGFCEWGEKLRVPQNEREFCVCRLNVHVQVASVWIKVETKVSECNQFLQRMLLSALLTLAHAALGRNSHYWEHEFIMGSCHQAPC
jgi:hypothetical protein